MPPEKYPAIDKRQQKHPALSPAHPLRFARSLTPGYKPGFGVGYMFPQNSIDYGLHSCMVKVNTLLSAESLMYNQ